MNKKILVLLPAMPDPSFAKPIGQSLNFILQRRYLIEYIDPYELHGSMDNMQYYQLWRERIASLLRHYDAFFGFALGGVILQQCLPLFKSNARTIVLFSSPTFIDDELRQKLKTVIALCQEKRLNEALLYLYQHVSYPGKLGHSFCIKDKATAAERLVSGLKRVLETDSSSVINSCNVPLIHFIGEESSLVKKKNILVPKDASLYVVPKAGMRVLEDNPGICQKIILEKLQ